MAGSRVVHYLITVVRLQGGMVAPLPILLGAPLSGGSAGFRMGPLLVDLSLGPEEQGSLGLSLPVGVAPLRRLVAGPRTRFAEGVNS